MIGSTDDHSWGLWQKWQDDIMEAILAAEAAGVGCGRRIGPFPCCSVVQGDCLELMKQLPDGCVDAVITDPPYGVQIAEWDAEAPLVPVFTEMRRACSGPVVAFGGAPIRSMRPFLQAEPDRCLIWKPSFQLGRPAGNGMFYTWHPIWCWNLPKSGDGLETDVFEEPTAGHNWWNHPATKPLSLMERIVGAWDHQAILDPFCGSGTTLVAAKKLGRHFLGFEISEQYCEISRRRLTEIDRQPSLFDAKPQQEEMF